MQRKKIRTRRLVLRPLQKADYATWREAVTGAQVSKFEPAPRSAKRSTPAAFDQARARQSRSARADFMYAFGVFSRAGVLVGMVDITVLHRGPLQLGNLGYRIFSPYRRRGYAKEAVLAMMHIAFKSLKLNRLEAVIDPPNRASRQLARSLGMTREGTRRKYIFENGRFHDQVVFSAQREDYGHAPLVLPG